MAGTGYLDRKCMKCATYVGMFKKKKKVQFTKIFYNQKECTHSTCSRLADNGHRAAPMLRTECKEKKKKVK